MKKIKKSFVAWSLIAALVSFPAFYLVMPYDTFLDLALSIALGVCLSATVRYGREAAVALKYGKTGADFLIVALFASFSILLGQRVFSLTLRVLDRPEWLVNSPITILVPWMIAWALSLALVAPDIDMENEESRQQIWKSAALLIAGALVGFVVAASFGPKTEQTSIGPSVRMSSIPSCKVGQIVGTGRKTYHTPQSRYRYIVVPRRCFDTETEAKAAGYAMVK